MLDSWDSYPTSANKTQFCQRYEKSASDTRDAVEFKTSRRVEFRDTDAAGIVHFSAFFPMMEAAEHEMLRSLGIPVLPHGDADSPPITWPRVAAECTYLSAARFEDLLDITARVGKIGSTSIRYEYQFRREGINIASGALTAVCCLLRPGISSADRGGLEKIPVPEDIRQRLSRYQ